MLINPFEQNQTLGYAVIPKEEWVKLTETQQEYLKNTFPWLLIVPLWFPLLLDIDEYANNLRGNAKLFSAVIGDTYRYNPERKLGYVLTTLATDKDGHTGMMWAADQGDSRFTAMVDAFADELQEILADIPIHGESMPDNLNDKEKARWEKFARYKKQVNKRADSFAGYDRDRVMRRIQNEKSNGTEMLGALNRCGHLVPFLNGVFDLHKVEFRSTRPDDYLTSVTPTMYVEGATDERVNEFLMKITCGRKHIEEYLQEVLGVGLDETEITKQMYQLYGKLTNNGKTTLVKAMLAALGNGSSGGLAQTIDPKAFGGNKYGSTLTPELASLGTSRLVFVDEPKENLYIDWALVKNITGGGYYSVNPKHASVYQARATFQMYWDSNFTLDVTDSTMFDRGSIQLVPFDWFIPVEERDGARVDAELSTENAKSAWLNWLIEGCLRYRARGKNFAVPAESKKAIDECKKNSDILRQFLDDNYTKVNDTRKKIKVKDVFDKYVAWCAEHNVKKTDRQSDFRRKMVDRGLVLGEKDHSAAFVGLVEGAMAETKKKKEPFDGKKPMDWFLDTCMVKKEWPHVKTEADEGIEMSLEEECEGIVICERELDRLNGTWVDGKWVEYAMENIDQDELFNAWASTLDPANNNIHEGLPIDMIGNVSTWREWFHEWPEMVTERNSGELLTNILTRYNEEAKNQDGDFIEFWALYGAMRDRGYDIDLAAPGTSEPTVVHGWAVLTHDELEAIENRKEIDEFKNKYHEIETALGNVRNQRIRDALAALLEVGGLDAVP